MVAAFCLSIKQEEMANGIRTPLERWKARLQFAVSSDGEAGGKLTNALTYCMKLRLSHS